MANFCGQCGSDTAGATRFCPRCGAAVTPTSAAPEPVPYDLAGAPTVYLPVAPPPPEAPTGYGEVPPTYGAVPPAYGAVPPAYGAVPPAYGQAPFGGVAPARPPRSSRRTAIVASAVAVVLAAGAAGAYVALRPHPTSSPVSASSPNGSSPHSKASFSGSPAPAEATDGSTDSGAPTDAAPTDDATVDDGLPTDDAQPADDGMVVAPADVQPLAVASVTASCTAPGSVDGNNVPTSYAASNVVDGDPETAWRCKDPGGPYTLTIDLGNPMVVTRLGLIPGFAKVDPKTHQDRWVQNRRITAVTYSFDDGTSVGQRFDAKSRSVQMSDIAPVRTQVVTITIDSTVPGVAGYDYTAISEVEFDGGEG